MNSIIAKYQQRVASINSLVCVGLDSEAAKLPPQFQSSLFAFNQRIIDQTHPYTVAYKPNAAFYEGAQWSDLQRTADYLRDRHPAIVTICDAKRGDIGSTSAAYARSIFDELGFDAVTLNPYLGRDALAPFLEREDKLCIILCRTSNAGAGEFQDMQIEGKPLWQHVAEKVAHEWNTRGNCALVVGATYPDELRRVRQLVGDLPILVPGLGAQGGDLQATVEAGLDSQRGGLILNSSRGIMFADDPAVAAHTFRDDINRYR